MHQTYLDVEFVGILGISLHTCQESIGDVSNDSKKEPFQYLYEQRI